MFKRPKIKITKKSLIFLAVFAVLLAVDLITKYIEAKYELKFVVIPNFIWVSFEKNTGAAFSFLADASWGQAFLRVITILMIIFIVVVFLFVPERFTVTKVALAAVLAGAVGNLVDRFMLGYVRDMVWVNMIFTEACCNFADFWITFGVAIIIIDMLFLNEWAVFPLTKKAKLAQKAKSEESAEHTDEKAEVAQSTEADSGVTGGEPGEDGGRQNDG